MLPGKYDIGFSLHIPSQFTILIQVRVKRAGKTVYKVFNGEGFVSTSVAADKVSRVDIFTKIR